MATATTARRKEMIRDAEPPEGVLPLQAKFTNLRDSMRGSLIERDNEINMLLLGLVSGEHVLFIGEPGTAKTKMIVDLVHGIEGANKFGTLLTKFSTPEEVFGPLNVAGMKEGRYGRITTSMLPDAHLAFFDEVWKASSAILNACLTAMEERKYFNEGKWHKMPLLSLAGASNEWPVGEGFAECGALFDRFLLRAQVKRVSPASLDKLLFNELPEVTSQVTLQEIHHAVAEAKQIPFDMDVQEVFKNIILELAALGVKPGDRRLRKSIGVVKAQAWLNGHDTVCPSDMECLKDVLWEDPREQPAVCLETVMKIANPQGAELARLLGEAEELLNLPSTQKAEVGPEFFSTIKKITQIRKSLEGIRKKTIDPAVLDKIDGAAKYLQERLEPINMKAVKDLNG